MEAKTLSAQTLSDYHRFLAGARAEGVMTPSRIRWRAQEFDFDEATEPFYPAKYILSDAAPSYSGADSKGVAGAGKDPFPQRREG